MDGFTFRGTHSSAFGLGFQSTDRALLPGVRENTVIIPGRDGVYSLQNATFDRRQITIGCSFAEDVPEDIPARCRKIAAWLSAEGELEFDDEPGVFYTARAVGGISLERIYRTGRFPLVFTCEPLAHSADQQQQGTFTQSGAEIRIAVQGTADAPCRIILRNTGTTTLSRITLSRMRENT